MSQIVSYSLPIIFILTGLQSLLYPDKPLWLLLAFVLASPILIAWIAYETRS